ncbi:hypothetical protein [Limosilactobacillus caccae]|uniref:hypothetical protein n=1 Tax=Limosilactobacillus caccae TaxID=1926284 RepID=UPI0009704AC6|nr:hypothetical protein [Limosilactobacillus caccae]
MEDIQAIIANYDYLNGQMTSDDGNHFRNLNSFIAAIGCGLELGFNFGGVRWYLGSTASGLLLSKDNGEWKVKFTNFDDLLDYSFAGKTIRTNWADIFINEF